MSIYCVRVNSKRKENKRFVTHGKLIGMIFITFTFKELLGIIAQKL